MKSLVKNFLILFLILLVIASIFSIYDSDADKPQEIGVGRLVEEINEESVEKIVVEGATKLNITLVGGQEQVAYKEATESLTSLLKNYDVSADKFGAVQLEVKGESGLSFWLMNILPFLIPLLLIGGFIYLMMRQVQGANNRAMMFGESGAKEANKASRDKIAFKDVAGVKEAKEELKEVVDFLKNPQKFTSLGAKIPKGVLLVGPPGSGKTLLAKAVAGEASVPFFSISGSEFVEMFVGVGASRVRDLFRKAKKSAPCIIFVDELDAVGRQRGAGMGGSHDEREQTLNQILVEMDGFDPNVGVILLAATNRPDILDKALLRPGRFDRRVMIDLPDIGDREAILKVHARKKPLATNVSLRRIAERTPGFSGADLANLLNEAAILAARRNKKIIEMDELIESIEKVMLGPERRSHVLSDAEKKVTAYHEAGHALVAHLLPNADPVHKISIISRGMAAGYTIKLPSEDKHLHTKGEFIDELAVFLAGFTTEKYIFNEVTTGATNDLARATKLAKRLVTQYGMSDELGPRTFGEREELIFLGREIHEQRDYSEKVAEAIDKEVSKLINKATDTAKSLIKKHKSKLDKVAKKLLEQETIEKEEFEKMMNSKKNSKG